MKLTKITDKITKIEGIMDDLTVKHVQEFQKKKQKMDVFSQSEESFRFIAGTASKPIPITKY